MKIDHKYLQHTALSKQHLPLLLLAASEHLTLQCKVPSILCVWCLWSVALNSFAFKIIWTASSGSHVNNVLTRVIQKKRTAIEKILP